MKNLLFYIFLIPFTTLAQVDSSKPIEPVTFSKYFNVYSQLYDDVYIYLYGSYYNAQYRILAKKNDRWESIQVWVNKLYYGGDSIVVKGCNNCDSIDKVLKAMDIANMKSENELDEPCIDQVDTTDIVRSFPRSLYDPAGHDSYAIIEFKIKDIKKRLVYVNINDAAQICPQSKIRQRFRTMVDAIWWWAK